MNKIEEKIYTAIGTAIAWIIIILVISVITMSCYNYLFDADISYTQALAGTVLVRVLVK